jgi:hypothetical protein
VPATDIRAGLGADLHSQRAGEWDGLGPRYAGSRTLNNRKLIRLSREAAETALARLLSPEEPSTGRARLGQWQVLYRHQVIDCRDESEAKALARTLLKRRLRISARLIDGQTILWTIEGRDQLRSWLSR